MEVVHVSHDFRHFRHYSVSKIMAIQYVYIRVCIYVYSTATF